MNHRRRRRSAEILRVYRERLNPLTLFTDDHFKKTYRLTKDNVVSLARQLKARGFKGPLQQLPKKRCLSAVLTVCIGVQFLATGSLYKDVGLAHHVVPSTVCRSVRKTIDLLNAIKEHHICFPTTREEMIANAEEYFRIGGFPGVVGAVDSTHIGVRPIADEAHVYKDRTSNYSLNVQVMCDPYLLFLDVDATWPGSCHDSYIWRKSDIGKVLEGDNFIQPFIILGDSGYPLRPWLITPYLHGNTERKRNFNKAHRSCRNNVEGAIRLLKIRFRCLDKTGGVLQSPPETATQIVTACMVLHNIAIRTGMALQINEDDDIDGQGREDIRRIVNGEPFKLPGHDEDKMFKMHDPEARDRQINKEGQQVRDAILNDYF